jgi:hypothetical protein
MSSNLAQLNLAQLNLAQSNLALSIQACSDSVVIAEWRYLAGRSGPLKHCHLKVLPHPAQLARLPMLRTTRQPTAK